jgi:adenosylcobinamide-GDP ribazoletransferase
MNPSQKFFASLAFLTRIPVPRSFQGTQDLKRASFYFPIVGLIVGALTFVVAQLLQVYVPGAAHLALMAFFLLPILLTGGLHLDGLADSSDGLFYAGPRARRLEIMRDSHLGTYGVTALVLDLLLRFYGSFVLWQTEEYQWLIILMPFAGKLGILFLLGFGKSPEVPGSMSQGLAENSFVRTAWLWALPFVAVWFWQASPWSWWVFVPLVFYLSVWAYKKLGSASGDLCGFTNEIWELVFLYSVIHVL